jgi:NitT/TauT family transport system permease protein
MSSDAATADVRPTLAASLALLVRRFGGRAVERVNPWLMLRIAIFYASLLFAWELLYRAEIWSPYLFPSPSEVWEELRRTADNGLLWDSIRETMRRLAIGFTLAFVIGMAIGIANGTMRWVDETLGSLVLGMQSLPSITWLPLAILWFGLS